MALLRSPAYLAALTLLGVTALQPAWPGDEPPRLENVGAAAVIAEGTHSAVTEPLRRVLRDAGALRALWTAHVADLIPPPAPPAVDFATSTVVAVFAGDQPSGGHALVVSGVSRTARGWHLRLSLAKPESGCVVTQAITQPWLMIRVPGRDQSVKIDIAESTRSCRG